MIRVENLTKYFGNIKAVENISFTVEKGEILGFLGPNAAGKTTTMRLLTCFFPPNSGKAEIAGYDIINNPLEVKRAIGYLPENAPLYHNLRVDSYLRFVCEAKGIPHREIKSRISRIVSICGLEGYTSRLIGKLSKGYKQRVALAQALINDPPILILDEPTVGLDPKEIIKIRELIKSFAGTRTVILSTHILPEVSMICQRVVIINQGRIIAIDTPENLNRQLEQVNRVALQVKGPSTEVMETIKHIEGVVRVTELDKRSGLSHLVEFDVNRDIRGELSRTIIKNNWELLELRTQQATLEDIFIKLVTREEGEG